MPATLFVPLEVLEVDTREVAQGHLEVSREWTWPEFPSYAWCLVRTLDGRVGVQASDSLTYVWEVILAEQPYHLCLQADGLVLLEARTPAGRMRLGSIGEALAGACDERESGLQGMTAKAPKGLPGLAQASESEAPNQRSARQRFIWTRGVCGLGLGAGGAWMIAMAFSGRTLSWGWILLLGFGVFPLIGYLWAARLWKRGRG